MNLVVFTNSQIVKFIEYQILSSNNPTSLNEFKVFETQLLLHFRYEKKTVLTMEVIGSHFGRKGADNLVVKMSKTAYKVSSVSVFMSKYSENSKPKKREEIPLIRNTILRNQFLHKIRV